MTMRVSPSCPRWGARRTQAGTFLRCGEKLRWTEPLQHLRRPLAYSHGLCGCHLFKENKSMSDPPFPYYQGSSHTHTQTHAHTHTHTHTHPHTHTHTHTHTARLFSMSLHTSRAAAQSLLPTKKATWGQNKGPSAAHERFKRLQ